MVAGRPRTVSLSEKEMIALGKEMVAWVKKNNPIHLSEWYSFEKMIIYEEWKTYIQKKEFIPYYEQALLIVGKNYLKKNSDVEPNIKQRWLRVYFKDLRDEEDQTAKYNAELSKQAQEAVNPELKQLASNICKEIKESRISPKESTEK